MIDCRRGVWFSCGMDDRAYHLQYSAHRAVALAIQSGSLVRQPCEICGAEGQAHHDSYYPDRWLVVRWLCRLHHRKWHDHNEAEWPSVYEFHPSEDHAYWRQAQSDGGLVKGRSGRRPRPWFRSARARWCVVIEGTHYDLGPNHEAAMKRFHELMGKAAE